MQPLPIWSDKIDLHEEAPIIVPYMAEQNPARSAVIICPGGGYRMRAWHEGEPVAEWLNTLGITAFVLHYRVNPAKHPEPLADVQRAIRGSNQIVLPDQQRSRHAHQRKHTARFSFFPRDPQR